MRGAMLMLMGGGSSKILQFEDDSFENGGIGGDM